MLAKICLLGCYWAHCLLLAIGLSLLLCFDSFALIMVMMMSGEVKGGNRQRQNKQTKPNKEQTQTKQNEVCSGNQFCQLTRECKAEHSQASQQGTSRSAAKPASRQGKAKRLSERASTAQRASRHSKQAAQSSSSHKSDQRSKYELFGLFATMHICRALKSQYAMERIC